MNGVFIKEIDAGALSITFFRCFFAGLFLAPLVRFRDAPRLFDLVVSIGLFAALLGLFVAATKETTAANAIFLQYTAPFYVIALAPVLLREHLRGIDLAAIAVCLGGVAVLFAGNAGDGDIGGMLMGLGSGLFFGLFMLWLRRMQYANPVLITFLNCVGVAAIFAAFPSVFDLGWRDVGLLALMAAVQFAVPYVLFTRGVRVVASAEASLIALVEPVLNPIWVFAVHDETPAVATILGGAIIILGISLRYTVFARWAPAVISEPGSVSEQA
jgi:drug/metabolite transporter (DMT)-like permease